MPREVWEAAGVEFCAVTRLLLPQPAATGEVRGPFPATCATCVQIRHRSVPEGVEKWRLREVQSLAQSHTAGERQGWGNGRGGAPLRLSPAASSPHRECAGCFGIALILRGGLFSGSSGPYGSTTWGTVQTLSLWGPGLPRFQGDLEGPSQSCSSYRPAPPAPPKRVCDRASTWRVQRLDPFPLCCGPSVRLGVPWPGLGCPRAPDSAQPVPGSPGAHWTGPEEPLP